ncbi:MAG TPA: hypothetical protein VGJ52_07985 [Vicinamibacterales bacterium]
MRAPLFVIVAFAIAASGCGSVEPSSPTTPTPVAGGVPSRSNNPGTAPAPSPTPSPTPRPSPTPTPTPVPAPNQPAPVGAKGNVQVTVSPNPVPFSGQPITDLASCSTRPNTWFYDQVLKETGGAAVTITRRVDSFDGAAGSATNPNLRIAANGTTSIRTRWCSVSASAHTAQSTFSGTDANGNSWTVTGPLVRLSAK